MNDLTKAKQQLHRAERQLNDWKMNGYDTPVMTYHEQMEEYEVRIQQLTELLKEVE